MSSCQYRNHYHKVRRSHDRLIFIMGFPNTWKPCLYIETEPCSASLSRNDSNVYIYIHIHTYIYIHALLKQNSESQAGVIIQTDPNSKVHGANMGPIWGRQDLAPWTLLSGVCLQWWPLSFQRDIQGGRHAWHRRQMHRRNQKPDDEWPKRLLW